MHEFFSVKVISLGELFSDSYHFRLPYFQRAYAWQTNEAGRLLSDVVEAMRSEKSARGYFLGKLMLAKSAASPESALVDGHQRVMTLTLLFSVLRDLASDPAEARAIDARVNGPTGPRLTPQDVNTAFLAQHVQQPGSTTAEAQDQDTELSETQINILENRDYLSAQLRNAEWSPETRRQLADYLTTNCYVMVSSVEDEDEAWQFLRIEEETHVGFNETDCAKWSLLSIVPAAERTHCQINWERAEALLGSVDLHALLGHLRTIKWRKRSERPVEVDLAKGLKLHMDGRALAFFERELLPNAERLSELRRGAFTFDRKGPSSLAAIADRMSWISPQLWVPAALLWLSQTRREDETEDFFKRLERLVWMMKLGGLDPTKQQSRIIQLLGEIDKGGPAASLTELEIGPTLKAAALANLRSPTFDAKHYDARVLRRISIALGQDPGPVHSHTLTIEHILPRGFSTKSGWRKHFPTRKHVQSYAHRLGNLTFLTAAENQAADTLDWADKRPILARSKLVLANRLGVTADWTPDSITKRTEELIRILFEAWDLTV